MRKYVTREVDVFKLPIGNVTVLHPEKCMLDFGRGYGVVDIGAYCYRYRSDKRRRYNECRDVDLSSLDRTRADIVRAVIVHISRGMLSGHSSATQWNCIRTYCVFIDWCDANGHDGIFGTENDARACLGEYIEQLRHRVNTNVLSNQSAAGSQSHIISLLNALFGADDMVRGLRLVPKVHSKKKTSLPSEEDVANATALAEDIFNGVTKHLLSNNPYPFKLKMPAYLGWTDNNLWVFPILTAFMAPHDIQRRDKFGRPNYAYDYVNGRLYTPTEVRHHFQYLYKARNAIRGAEKILAAANTDEHHHVRIALGMLAHNSFMLLFEANTGMNASDALRLTWGTSYVIEPDRQGFRSIKYRARNKPVSFEIRSIFLPMFKRYLVLRDYLLNGRLCHTLFFSLGTRNVKRPQPVLDNVFNGLFGSYRRIDPALRSISWRQWRAYKHDCLSTTTDRETAARVLQHKEETANKHYPGGTETRWISEYSIFYEKLPRTVQTAGQPLPLAGGDTALGGCVEYGKPNRTDETVPIEPDCRQKEGCLFCDKFVVHADQKDIRKLISTRYYLRRTEHLSDTQEQFQALFGEALKRIAAILETIVARSTEHEKLVEKVRYEVEEEGQLDPYWKVRIALMVELGMVSA